MASQEDDNKIECISNINKQQERHFLNVYKKHEYILNSKNELFNNKIKSLIDVWKSVGELNLSQFDLRHVIQIMDWAKLHALNIVLTAEWNNFKATYQSKLLEEIEKAQNELLKLNSAFATRCKKLADVVNNPWEDTVLMKLMKTKEAEIGEEEIEFFCVETAYLVSVRLKKLCESHCEDLALNLVTAFMKCDKLSKTQNFSLNATDTQMWFIFDIYIALLYKFQERQKIVVLLKELSFEKGLQLVKRFAKKRVKISKIWKNCQRVAILAAQMYISQAVVKYTDELKEFLESYLEVYISLCTTDALLQDFSTSIRRISNLADAGGLYIFCAVIQRLAGLQLKPFVIEMYIRALTTDMNELERQKDANEVEKVAGTTSRLAAAFCNLADFLDEHVKVARECVLTAFSLEPTKERLDHIEVLAKRSGFIVLDTGQEWKCKLHPPTLPSDEITWMCPECGEWMSKPEFNVPIKINMALNEALQNSILGISEALCDDLVVCLSNPRYQILSWFLPWEELHRLCLMYLQDPQATKNIVTELKFVDIDYTMFKGIKREPIDELEGIERGYEQYLDQDFVSDEETSSNSEDSMSQDSRPYSLGSDGAGEGPYLPMLPAQTKSDPNTLKSLRMFRPSLKRAREKETGEGTPEKLFKADPSNSNVAHTVTSSPVDPPKVETKPPTSLNQLLNKAVIPKYSAIQYPKPYKISTVSSTCETDFNSKNVKTATLPLLGGQVAKKENTLIQVNNKHRNSPQERKTPSLLKNQLHNRINKTEMTRKDPQLRILNKYWQNGLKENNSCSLTNLKIQDFHHPSPDLKIYTKQPSTLTKHLNSVLVVTIPRTEHIQLHTVHNQDNSKLKLIQDVQLQQLIQEQQSSPQLSKNNLNKNLKINQPPLDSQSQFPEKRSVQQLQNNIQHQSVNHQPPIIRPSQSLLKPHILNKLVFTQIPSQKEFCNQQAPYHNLEDPEQLQASQLHPLIQEVSVPLVREPITKLSNTFSLQPRNSTQSLFPRHQLQTEEIRSENHLPSCVLSLMPLSNPSKKLSNTDQTLTRPIKFSKLQANPEPKQEQAQTETHCTIALQQPASSLVNSQENLPKSSYQCLKPNSNQKLSHQQKTSTSPSHCSLQNLILQIPLVNQLSSKNEATLKKLLEDCSSRSPKLPKQAPKPPKQAPKPPKQVPKAPKQAPKPPKQAQLEEQEQVQKSAIKLGQHTLLTLLTPLKLNSMSQLPPSPKFNNNLQSPASPKLNKSCLQSPVSPKLNNNLHSTATPPQLNNSHQFPTYPKLTKSLQLTVQLNLNGSSQLSVLKSNNRARASTPPNLNNKTYQSQTVHQSNNNISLAQTILKLSNKTSQAQTILKSNNKTSQPQTVLKPNNKTSQSQTVLKSNKTMQLQTVLESNNKTSQVQTVLKSNRPSQATTPKLNKSQALTSPNLNNKTCQVPTHPSLNNNKTSQLPMPPNLNSNNTSAHLKPNSKTSHSPCMPTIVTKQKASQANCFGQVSHNLNQEQLKELPQKQIDSTTPLLSLVQEQQVLDNVDNLQLQCNQRTSPPVQSRTQSSCSQQQEQKPVISKGKVQQYTPSVKQFLSSRHISQPVKVQNQNSKNMEEKQSNQLTNKSLLRNNSYSSLRVPNLCPNSDRCPTFPMNLTNLQMFNRRPEEPTELVDLNKSKATQQSRGVLKEVPNQTLQKPLSIEVKKSTNLDKEPSREPILFIQGNQTIKLGQEPEPTTNKQVAFNKQQQTNSIKTSRELTKTKHKRLYQTQRNFYSSLDITPNRNDSCDKAEIVIKLNDALKCNSSIFKTNVTTTSESYNNEGSQQIANLNSKQIAQFNSDWNNCHVKEDFSEAHLEELCQNYNYSALVKKEFLENNDPHEVLPKNKHLTENIRTYTKKSKRKVENKDCVKTLTCVDVLDVCKNVNNINSTENLHSNVQSSPTNSKELKIILCRLPSNKKTEGKCTASKDEYPSIKQKCDRGKIPPKNSRRRKSLDKSENKVGKTPNLVQNHNLSPLQDVNLRVNSQINSKACCDFNKLSTLDEIKTDRIFSEKVPDSKKGYLKSVLSNVPGLNDFQMIRPLGVNQIVNVIQVSEGRSTQSVSIQNSQTSTQVTPHIQRIGQPRVSDQKPEHSNSLTSTTQTPSTTSATSRTTTSQPSTLINILSQQIVRPVSNQTNTVRRQGPLINILSQQIIRPSPSLTPKTTVNSINSTPSTEASQVKVVVSTEPTILNSTIKTTNSIVKNPNTVATGQGGTILQFICKSSLPKFQQAFGKTVYQNNTEAADSPTTTVEVTNSASTDTKKTTITTKTVPVNVQPIQGSVIYSRQVPVGQTISLIPPGGTTRQVFRIATSNPDQISLVKDSVIHSKMSALLAAALQGRPKNSDGEIQVNCEEIKGTVARPTLVQSARIVKPVQLQLPSNVRANPQQPNLSSTTLEQLREFDMVYKQIKERSNTSTSETSTNSGENQDVAPQRISVTYVNQLQKYTQLSPVVVVTTYNNLQPAASPALSVTSQGSSSPCVTPASTPTLPKIATKNSKGKTLKTTTNNTVTKSSPIPKPQQKPQEDEHITQRIFDILAEYSEQLRNSPDLNNKPAPRRRSNPPTNPSQNSKRKKCSSGVKKSGQSSSTLEMDTDDITIGSEDSSGGGVVQLSVTDDEQSQASASVNTTESNDNASPPSSRPVILAEGGTCTNQSRNLIIADSSVGEALKIPNTAVIVPGSYIMPVSMVKGGQQIAVVSGGSKILATVPARSGQNMLLFQSFTNQNRKGAISAVKYSTIQPISGISTQTLAGVSQQPVIIPSNSVATAVALGQPLTLKKIGEDRESSELLLTISHQKDEPSDGNDIPQPDSSTSISSDSVDIKIEDSASQSDNSSEKIFQTYQNRVINSVETSVIATTSSTIKQDGRPTTTIINVTPTTNVKCEPKSGERMQSVLVTACSSNGPMLSHTTPRYRKASDATRTHNSELPVNKEDFLHNGEKPNNEQKNFRGTTTYYVNKTKKVVAESQKIDSEMQKQAAMERELRLQKTLSEECEDLGVDEPSASDLFPEADLLFDSNHSPSFDQTSQDVIKQETIDIKEEVKETMNLFSDDENSGSLRADLFEYVEYQPVESALDYQARQMNGNTAESGSSSCEDNTLLPKCAAMSEVTLNSPISPEMYQEANMHKYKFKYSNRKKGERIKQNEYGGEVVTSSEDTVVCTELSKVNCEEESYKVVHVTKTDFVKEDEKCELHCDEDVDSPSGRGARRSVRKLCSCCNGSQDGNLAKKRPHTSRPHTPAVPHKKAFLNKKR